MMRRHVIQPLLLFVACAALMACNSNVIKPINVESTPPDNWQSDNAAISVADGWLNQLGDAELTSLVRKGLEKNRALAQVRFQVAQAEQQLIISGADELPALDLNSSAGRSRSNGNTDNSFNLNGQLSWELDIWGKLDDQTRQAHLNLAAQRASLADAEQQLAQDMATGWYRLQEAQLLLALFQQRRSNLQQNLELIESRYQQGLNTALDVYLARNDLGAEEARISAQRQTELEARRTLEQLLADYPAGQLTAVGSLSMLESAIPAGLPSELIKRRPDLQARWLELLAADAAVAVAQKERFPSLTLTSSLGSGSSDPGDLLQSGSLAWSLAAALGQNLFDGGRREATQALRFAERQEREQRYLDAVYQAFQQVENRLSNHQALQQQYLAYLEARSNADAAQALAFEQYQKGLTNYTTVLESQRRAFDARTNVIQLRSRLLINRVDLYRALGGHFDTAGYHEYSERKG